MYQLQQGETALTNRNDDEPSSKWKVIVTGTAIECFADLVGLVNDGVLFTGHWLRIVKLARHSKAQE